MACSVYFIGGDAGIIIIFILFECYSHIDQWQFKIVHGSVTVTIINLIVFSMSQKLTTVFRTWPVIRSSRSHKSVAVISYKFKLAR